MRTEIKIPDPRSAILNLKFEINSSAADEMDDLDLVGIFDANSFPILFAHYFLIQFDSDASLGQREMLEQFSQFQISLDFFGFAVDKNSHGFYLTLKADE